MLGGDEIVYEHHDLQVATMHVHLDYDISLEVAVLRGEPVKVTEFAKTVIAERGVTHGLVSFIPAARDAAAHSHGGLSHGHNHSHPEN